MTTQAEHLWQEAIARTHKEAAALVATAKYFGRWIEGVRG